jgi:hypothetical protein
MVGLLTGDADQQGAAVRCFARLIGICPRSAVGEIPKILGFVGELLSGSNDSLNDACCCCCIGAIAGSQAESLLPFFSQIIAAFESILQRRYIPK